jgi:D-sedoheptulose 7-phosphate isomerase
LEEYNKTKKFIEKIISNEEFLQNVETIAQICTKSLQTNNKIMFCGNGGSAADSQHLVSPCGIF